MSNRYRGTCAVCSKKLIVRVDGTIGEHQSADFAYCYGMESPPIETSSSGLQRAIEKAKNDGDRQARNVAHPAEHWRPESVKSMAQERDKLYELADSLRLKLASWKPGTLEKAEAAKKRIDYGSGTCCVCNRKFKLKKNGKLRSHNYHPETILNYVNCEGEDLRPLEETNIDCRTAITKMEKRLKWASKKLNSTDNDKYEIERLQINIDVLNRYIENCKRNADIWTSQFPVPDFSMDVITTQLTEYSDHEIANQFKADIKDATPHITRPSTRTASMPKKDIKASGCLTAIPFLIILPLAGFYFSQYI